MNSQLPTARTITVPAVWVEPSLLLFQPSFPLTEADFLRLRSYNPAWAAAGGAVLSFGLSFGLPFVVRTLRSPPAVRRWVSDDLWITLACMLVGALLIVAGYAFNSQRRRVLKSIKQHFAENPGSHTLAQGAS